MSLSFKAIIWDCDGVLINSPTIFNNTAADYLTEKGYPVTRAEYKKSYLFTQFNTVVANISKETGKDFSAICSFGEVIERQIASFPQELKTTPDVTKVLDSLAALSLPMAIASDSGAERLSTALDITGLKKYFNGHIFHGDQVSARKPSPELFLMAADSLGIAPKECLVIEDGISGIQAAKAAGMTVYAYLGGGHFGSELKKRTLAENPDKSFRHMRDLKPLLGL